MEGLSGWIKKIVVMLVKIQAFLELHLHIDTGYVDWDWQSNENMTKNCHQFSHFACQLVSKTKFTQI